MPTVLNQAQFPFQDRVVNPRNAKIPRATLDPNEGLMTFEWQQELTKLVAQVGLSPARVNAVALAEQDAAIGATDVADGALSAGLYQLQYYARITQAAGVSSSLTITLSFTDGGVPQSIVGAAMTGNTTTTIQDATHLIRVDTSTPVTYAVAYASVGAPVMKYSLDVVLSLVQV